jgi:hypothetical protein
MVGWCFLFLSILTWASAAAHADCRLALALAMDVSRSVDEADYAIMTEGLATALEDPMVQQAFFAPAGDVALAVYQWSGETNQQMLVDWVMVTAPDDLAMVAAAIRAADQPPFFELTALGEALVFGHALLARAPDCGRRVLDVAGDGQNNQGRTPARVYAKGDWQGITVNALAIRVHELRLVQYFADEVIRGPGAFVELAERQEDFPAAIRRKLIRELTEAISWLAAPDLRKS